MEMALPRTSRICSSVSASRSRPSNSSRPATMRPGGDAMSLKIESEVTLLPQPDSPTTASVSPAATENDTPSTARTTPSRVKKCVLRSSTSNRAVVTSSPFHLLSHPPCEARIERVAHTVAQQIHREHRQRQEQPREENEIA